jgi:hypothetical protein
MRSFSSIGLALALGCLVVEPAFPQVAEDLREWVQYQDGKISVAFDQTPIEVALNAIQVRTGLQIIIPPVTERKLLNLRLSGLPLEPAVRFLVASIGFRSFALMYDAKGRPERAVVLDARPEVPTASTADSSVGSQSVEPAVHPVTVEERALLEKELQSWNQLKQQDRSRIEDRLRAMAPSEDREQLLKEYARQLLGINK